MSLVTASRRWRSLSRAERRLVRSVGWSAAMVAISLRLRGYRTTLRAVEAARTSPKPAAEVDDAARLATGVLRRIPWSPNCLERSLVLVRVLLRLGADPELRIGVRRAENGLEFHAWVEIDGRLLGEAAADVARYQSFGAELPPQAKFV